MDRISYTKPADLDSRPLSTKLWIYTNYDCNLHCSYCVAESHPRAPKRAVSLATVKRIIDEAVELGFESIYFTGGEPFILDNIYETSNQEIEWVESRDPNDDKVKTIGYLPWRKITIPHVIIRLSQILRIWPWVSPE